MFVRLGLLNSSRQLSRSLLVVLTMALAAVSLTSALSFSKGIMPNSNTFYRNFLGGEILVFPARWAGHHNATEGSMELRQLRQTGLSWLEVLYPELYTEGFPASQDSTEVEFSELDITRLQNFTGITGASSIPVMTASLHKQKDGVDYQFHAMLCPAPKTGLLPQAYAALLEQGGSIAIKNKYVWLDERRVVETAESIPDSAVMGEEEFLYPTKEDLRIRKERMAREQLAQLFNRPAKDDTVSLSVPYYLLVHDQLPTPDYSRQIRQEFTIAAEAAIPTRSIRYSDSYGSFGDEQGYLHLPLVWIPAEKWDELWLEASGGAPHPVTTLALQVDDMSRLEDTVLSLQKAFPDFTFQSVTSLADRVETKGLLDFFYLAPESYWRPNRDAALNLPLSLGRTLAFLMYLVAGMFVASRMVTGAATRRKEIGVLKALGARRNDIIAMALSEAFLVAFVGNTLGFLLVKGAGVAMELSNKVSLSRVVGSMVTEYWVVTGAAVVISIVFAYVPATRMARLTTMDVLRTE